MGKSWNAQHKDCYYLRVELTVDLSGLLLLLLLQGSILREVMQHHVGLLQTEFWISGPPDSDSNVKVGF